MPDGFDRRQAELMVRQQAIAEQERRKRMVEQKEEAEQDLLAFIHMFWHVVEPTTEMRDGWVLDAMCDALMAITDGHIRRLIINVSPGSMKSLLLNVFWPAWEWGPQRRPSLRYISASYNEALPERDNDRFRRVISDPVYRKLWGTDWRLTKESMSLVENTKTGWKRTTSTHSGTTGHRGDRILIDDANDPNNVESDSVRGSTTHWLREVMPDRLNNLDEGAIICLQQRTHEMDATGVLAKYGQGYQWLCYDQETEILTKRGWIPFPLLLPNDDVMAVDITTLAGQWERPLRVVEFDYSGDLIYYRSTLLDLAVTPDHRMVFKDYNDWDREEGVRPFSGRRHHWRTARASKMPNHAYLPQAIEWTGDNSPVEFGGYVWHDLAQFGAFMGWYLAEGSASAIRCTASLVQKRGARAEEIDALLRSCPFGNRVARLERKDGCSQWSIYGKQLATTLAALGTSHTKIVPRCVLDLPPYALECFVGAYMKGDGGKAGRNGRGLKASSRSKALIDGVQECYLKLGRASSVTTFMNSKRHFNGYDMPVGPMWAIYVRWSKSSRHSTKWYAKLRSSHVTTVPYEGTVHCVTVSTGAIVVRRSGKPTISGNCIPMEFDPLRIGSVVMERDEEGSPTRVWVDPRSLDTNGDQLEGLELNDKGEYNVRMGSPMAKAEGLLAWPERFSPEAMEEQKATKGPYAWSSQYSQWPGVRGGSIIRREWWKTWLGEYPEIGTVIVSLDTAVEMGTQNDYNACIAWGAFAGLQGEPLFLALAAWRERLPLAQLIAKVHDTCRERKADYLLIEHKTRGRDVYDELARLYQNMTWETVLIKPGTSDKTSRLKAVEHLFSGDYRVDPKTKIESWEGGVVWIPDRDWADEVISEVAAFPYGAHDDYVDCTSMALGFARKNGVVLRKVEWSEAEEDRQKFRRAVGVPYTIKRG